MTRFLASLLGRPADARHVRDIIAKSMAKEPLEVEETAVLVNATQPELVESIFDAARQLKRDVYGNRIVLFAPLYIGNDCTNECEYCGFRASNARGGPPHAGSRGTGHSGAGAGTSRTEAADSRVWRTPPVLGRVHRRGGADGLFGAEGHGEIRRVNINAAPMDHDGFRTIREAGIGTYQIFQETYHHRHLRVRAPCRERAKVTTCGVSMRSTAPGKAAVMMSGLGPCSASTTGDSKCWDWSPTPGT